MELKSYSFKHSLIYGSYLEIKIVDFKIKDGLNFRRKVNTS